MRRLLLTSASILTSFWLVGCATTSTPAFSPQSAETPAATLTIKYDSIRQGNITNWVNDSTLTADLGDYQRTINAEHCKSKTNILGREYYYMNRDDLSYGKITTKLSDEDGKTISVDATRPYVLYLEYDEEGGDSIDILVSAFIPKPNTDYLFKYNEIKTSRGNIIGDFEFYIKQGNTLKPIPESDIAPIDFVKDCQSYLQNKQANN